MPVLLIVPASCALDTFATFALQAGVVKMVVVRLLFEDFLLKASELLLSIFDDRIVPFLDSRFISCRKCYEG